MPTKLAHKDDSFPGTAEFQQDVLNGLRAEPKTLPCKYFYDQRGSELFGKICETPEYYVTRTETSLLRKIAPEISARLGAGCDILELGSGLGEKIRILLNALDEPTSYTPMDISEEVLLQSVRELHAIYPDIRIRPWIGDYMSELDAKLGHLSDLSRRVVFFPGSTISNFTPKEARAFLGRIRRWLGRSGVLLIGVDTVKPSNILNAAYNDIDGYTAAFNLNLLHRICNELATDLNLQNFSHSAFFNEEASRIEMHLVSDIAQSVVIDDELIEFGEGETIHTENSYKYGISDFHHLAESAGFRPEKFWTDPDELFSFHYLEVA